MKAQVPAYALALLAASAAALAASLRAYGEPLALVWAASLLGAALAYGSLSSLLVARRALFLGGALPHLALLASAAGLLLELKLSANPIAASAVASAALALAAGLAASRARDPDKVVAAFVGVASSLSVLTLTYISYKYPAAYRVSALLLGDPLLSSKLDAAVSLATGLAALAYSRSALMVHVALGLSRESAVLAGARALAHDAALYCLLGASTALLMKVVGFVMTHVLLLMPGVVASLTSSSAREAFAASVAVAVSSAALALAAGLIADLSPNGLAGAVLLAAYVAIYVARRGAK